MFAKKIWRAKRKKKGKRPRAGKGNALHEISLRMTADFFEGQGPRKRGITGQKTLEMVGGKIKK